MAQVDDSQVPVVVPFDLPRAGAKVSLEFTVTDERTNLGKLRGVYIGLRSVGPRTDSDADTARAIARTNYLEKSAVPIRLRVWRVEDDSETLVFLKRQADAPRGQHRPYVTNQGDVFDRLRPANPDWAELEDAGKSVREDMIDINFEIALVQDLMPGRYRLEAESLASHPVLSPLHFDFMVTKEYRY